MSAVALPPDPAPGPRLVRAALSALALLAVAGCDPGPGGDPAAVQAVAEQAAAAREAGDFESFAACYTGDKAGRYREELGTTYGGDVAAFFAGKRRMVVTGPVTLRRQAFATVGLFVEDSTGYKPMVQAGAVYREGRWLLDTFVPGDVERPRTEAADLGRVLDLLRAEAGAPRPPAGDGSFRRIQLVRALEVVADRRPAAAAGPLSRLLSEDPDAAVRQFAAHLLGELEAPDANDVLRRALGDDDLRVRGDAAWALARLGDAGSLPELRRLAEADSSPWVRQQADRALEQLAAAPAP